MKKRNAIAGLIIGGVIGGFGLQFMDDEPISVVPQYYDIALVRIQKADTVEMSHREIWEEPFRYDGEYGKIETTIYPVKLSMPCGCSIVIKSAEEFPKESVPCDCKDKFFLIKIEDIEEGE